MILDIKKITINSKTLTELGYHRVNKTRLLTFNKTFRQFHFFNDIITNLFIVYYLRSLCHFEIGESLTNCQT